MRITRTTTSIAGTLCAALLCLAGCVDSGLPPSGSGDGAVTGGADLADAGGPSDIARWPGDGPRVGCGAATCNPDQVCVMPVCCPQCAQIPADGQCPPGASIARCPVGGGMMCVTPCTPPPPRCEPIPASCKDPTPCRCLDARTACSAYGGMCATTLPGDGVALFCMGCF